ncbi:hypothetical protein AVEN_38907-1 [Araneus ventricosus]|uniref:Uncharacterized protein n=1 Tax=Araneus ventricosus TaxID=182803 RepID=A0A4Y2V9X0_ARAVE|nr:hypothetical protein AVEN_38907-1 [Araneus ventricosus]
MEGKEETPHTEIIEEVNPKLKAGRCQEVRELGINEYTQQNILKAVDEKKGKPSFLYLLTRKRLSARYICALPSYKRRLALQKLLPAVKLMLAVLQFYKFQIISKKDDMNQKKGDLRSTQKS